MTQLFNKTLKRAACFFIAALLLFGTAFMFTSCQSSTPKITITISFNNKDYSLSYKLYRKYFPNTVQHFIELADAGYYNGLCVHDYKSGDGMYTGGYTYSEATSGDTTWRGLEEREYFSWLSENNVTLTQTVFKYVDTGTVPTEGTNTLVGEFSSNNYNIKDNTKKFGAKNQGSLVMYYNSKSNTKLTNVTVKRNTKISEKGDNWEKGAEWYDTRDYSKNATTSLFYISLTSESTVNSNYCVFADLYNDDAEETYSNLLSAINSYISANFEEDDEDDFTETTGELPVDTEDWYYKDYNLTATYEVPVSPIIIKRVKVDRY